MMTVLLSALLVVILLFSIYVSYLKRKKAGIKGFKSSLTSLCLFLIPVVNLIAYYFHFTGVISWGITIFLLLLSAYFTRYLPRSTKENY